MNGLDERRASVQRTHGLRTVSALAAWAGVIVLAHVLLERLARAGVNVKLKAPPLFGVFEDRSGWRVVLSVAVALVVVWIGPRVARHLEWRALLVVVGISGALWAVALALIDGPAGLNTALELPSRLLRGCRARRRSGSVPVVVRRSARDLLGPRACSSAGPGDDPGRVGSRRARRHRGGSGAVHRRRRIGRGGGRPGRA